MKYVREKYVEFFFPGTFFNESEVAKIKNRDLSKIKVPDGSFGFIFFDIVKAKIVDNKEVILLSSERINKSPMHYYGGTFYTVDELKKQFPEKEKLIKNAIYNEWKGAIKCRTGNWHPLLENDHYIKEEWE